MAVKGLDELIDNLHELEAVTLKGAEESLNTAAEALKQIAEPLTPMKTGALRRSVRIFRALRTIKWGLRAIVAWGGKAAPYAAWVHDMPGDFNYTTPGTGGHYATRAASLLASLLPEQMAKNIGMKLVKKFPATSRKGRAVVTVELNG